MSRPRKDSTSFLYALVLDVPTGLDCSRRSPSSLVNSQHLHSFSRSRLPNIRIAPRWWPLTCQIGRLIFALLLVAQLWVAWVTCHASLFCYSYKVSVRAVRNFFYHVHEAVTGSVKECIKRGSQLAALYESLSRNFNSVMYEGRTRGNVFYCLCVEAQSARNRYSRQGQQYHRHWPSRSLFFALSNGGTPYHFPCISERCCCPTGGRCRKVLCDDNQRLGRPLHPLFMYSQPPYHSSACSLCST